MEYATAGGVVIFSSLIGVGTALMKRLQPLTTLTFCDAIFTAIIGCSLVARAVDWINKHWDLAVFCAALSQAQHSSLNTVAHSHGIRGIKLASLVTLSWAVPASWTTLFVTLPQSCSQNQHLIYLMVQKIYSVVQKYNRTRRIFEDLKPTWFEEQYDEDGYYDEILEQRNEQNITNATSVTVPSVIVHFPAVNMTLVPPAINQCEEPTQMLYLVTLVFLSYVLPILLISTFREKTPDVQQLVIEQPEQQQRPIPRPRSAPPSIIPRQNYARTRSQLSTASRSTGHVGLIRLLIIVNGIVFIPALASSLLHIQNNTTTRVLQLSATSMHAIVRTTVNARLIITTRVQPT